MNRTSLALLLLAALPVRAATPGPRPTTTFEQHIRPILKAHCLECHGETKKLRGGLDLRLRRLLVEGGDSGAAIVPGKPAQSPLYQRIRDHQMPPGKVKLPPADVRLIADWISAGAPTARPEPAKLTPGLFISEDDRAFWSFQPIRTPPVPVVRAASLVRNPIDAFLLARLEAAGLTFASSADRTTLVRRLSFDLIGLPPSPEEIDAFVHDNRPDAHERLVDRLLASPHHGERWGRHWLDVAGYADSHGYTGTDPVRRHSWKYRDWVIRAFNADMPYDRFVLEQLAGDELVTGSHANLRPIDRDRLVATGFLRTAPDGTASPGVDATEARNQLVADTVQIVSTAVLGLTVHCAQCHNHRYDPIPQTDYYRLRAIFEPAYDVKNWRPAAARLISLSTPADRARAVAIEQEAGKIEKDRLARQTEYIEQTFKKQLAKVPENIRATVETAYRTPARKRSVAQAKLLREHPSVNVSPGSLYLYDKKAADDLLALATKANQLRATKPVEDFIDALTEVPGKVPVTHLFDRGDPQQPREAVTPGGLTILAGLDLGPIPEKDASLPTTGRRLAFARQLVSGKHPLVARAIVNRVWMHHFGKGLVNTPGDLGMLGERPSHPELLDWLASDFMRDWSLRRLHRLIVTSSAYRQSSLSAAAQKIDPDNRLLGRMPIRRLEAEILRDAVLAVTGRLERRQYGPFVPVMPDTSGQVVLGVDLRDGAGYLRGQPVQLGREVYRRSVYVQVRRSMPLTVLETFDNPILSPSCEKRSYSTSAMQSLQMMNSDFMVENAAVLATRLSREAADDRARVRLAWRLVFGREPSTATVAEATSYLAEQTAHYTARKRDKNDLEPGQQALATWCHALLSSNPFLYVN